MYGVDARRKPLDETGAKHEPVAGDLGIGRGFLQRGNEELTGFHGRGSVAVPASEALRRRSGVADARSGARSLTRVMPVQ